MRWSVVASGVVQLKCWTAVWLSAATMWRCGHMKIAVSRRICERIRYASVCFGL